MDLGVKLAGIYSEFQGSQGNIDPVSNGKKKRRRKGSGEGGKGGREEEHGYIPKEGSGKLSV